MLHHSHARFAVYVEQTHGYCFIVTSAVQYSLLVFEIVFYNICNITDGAYKGVGGWEGVGVVGWGGWASLRQALSAIRSQTVVLCPQQMTGKYTNHRIGQDGHWQQFGIQPILISAPQWANRPCNAPTRPYRVSKSHQFCESRPGYL